MRGIVGIVGKADVSRFLREGLNRLDPRDCGGAGIALANAGGIDRHGAGRIADVAAASLPAVAGIGHTWRAAHGMAGTAHPCSDGRVAVVHTGSVENLRELRDELAASGDGFASTVDADVVVRLISDALRGGMTPRAATAAAMRRLDGAFALAVLFEEGVIVGARKGAPLAVGYGAGAAFLASDAEAIGLRAAGVVELVDDDIVAMSASGVEIFDAAGAPVERRPDALRHFMHKEIHQQAAAIGETLRGYLDPVARSLTLPPLPFDLATIARVTLLACGTPYYAAMVAKSWIEDTADLPVDIDFASEFRCRAVPAVAGRLAVLVSQSGETADTLAALRLCRAAGVPTLAVVNVPDSTMAREADAALPTLAGPEISIASTKAFTTQLATLACFAIGFAKARGALDRAAEAALVDALLAVPGRIAEVLRREDAIRSVARDLRDARSVIYLGRGTAYPIALEGALKLKETSYIHAEALAAGEFRHGPIALVDADLPVVVVAPPGVLFDKTAANLREVAARGGKVVVLSDAAGAAAFQETAFATVALPEADAFVAPMVYAVPLQLLAYHVAVLKGTDVDRPRNLAKSVEVD